VVDINSAFLAANTIATISPCLADRLELVGAERRIQLKSAIAEFLGTMESRNGPLIIKDPRLCLVFSDWLAVALKLGHRPIAVQIFRNPYEVADSLRLRDGLSDPLSLVLWMNYNLLAERDSRTIPRLFVSFDSLLADWEAVVARCRRALNVNFKATPSATAAVQSFLSPDLRHHSGSHDLSCPLIELRANEIFSLLSKAESGIDDRSSFNGEIETLCQVNPQFAEEAARSGAARAKTLREEVRQLKFSTTVVEEHLAKVERALRTVEVDISTVKGTVR